MHGASPQGAASIHLAVHLSKLTDRLLAWDRDIFPPSRHFQKDVRWTQASLFTPSCILTLTVTIKPAHSNHCAIEDTQICFIVWSVEFVFQQMALLVNEHRLFPFTRHITSPLYFILWSILSYSSPINDFILNSTCECSGLSHHVLINPIVISIFGNKTVVLYTINNLSTLF